MKLTLDGAPPDAPPVDRSGDYGLGEAVARADWDAVAHVVQHRTLEIASLTGHAPLLASALAAMPADARQAHPGLLPTLEFFGVVPIADPAPLHLHEDRLRGGGHEAALEIRSLIAALMSYRFHQRIDLALRLVDAATPHVVAAASTVGTEAETVASAYFVQAGNTYLLSDRTHLARRALAQAWRWRYRDCLGFVAHETSAKLAAMSASSGDLGEAEFWLGESRAWPADCAGQTTTTITFAGPLAEFVIATDRLDLARAEALLPTLAQPTQGFEFGQCVAHARVRYLLLRGRPIEALRFLDEAASVLNETPRRPLNQIHVDALLAAGNVEEALDLLDALADGDTTHLQRARAAMLRLDGEAAITHLDALSATPTRRVNLEARALRAATSLGLGRRDDARRAFTRLLDTVDDNLSALATIRPDSARALFALCRAHPRATATEDAWRERTHASVYPFRRPPDPSPGDGLTDREAVMLRYLAAGVSRAAIARRETVSINTVKTQIAALYRKLDVSNAGDAIMKAQARGWL